MTKEKERTRVYIRDVLDIEFAEELLLEGWTVADIAEDFDFEADAMRNYLQNNGLRLSDYRAAAAAERKAAARKAAEEAAAEAAAASDAKKPKISEVLDPDHAQNLMNEGWTIKAIAEDFNFSPSAMASYLDRKGVKRAGRRKRVFLLDYIDVETLINKIQGGCSPSQIAAELPEEIEPHKICGFVGNHYSTFTEIRQDATEFREAVNKRLEKRRSREKKQQKIKQGA